MVLSNNNSQNLHSEMDEHEGSIENIWQENRDIRPQWQENDDVRIENFQTTGRNWEDRENRVLQERDDNIENIISVEKPTTNNAKERDSLKNLVDQSFLPEFANEEVRKFNKLVLQAEKALREAEESVDEENERAIIMENHIKRVEREIFHTQCRVENKRREIDAEKHMTKLSEMETVRIRREIVKLEKENDESLERIHCLNALVFKANEKMEEFRLIMKWNQEELEQWAQAAKQKEEDDLALESYTKSDNAKLKELHLEADKVSSELCALQQELDAEITTTKSAQIELDRTAQIFRDMHQERQQLVSFWEDAIETIHKRDEAIHQAAEDFANNKTLLRERKQELDYFAQSLQKEADLNKDLERAFTNKEEEVTNINESYKKEIARTKEADEELELMKRNVQNAQKELALLASKKRQAEEELSIKTRKLKAVGRKLADLEKKSNEEYSLLDTLDKKRQELDKMLVAEEASLKAAKKEVADLREKHFEAAEKLNEWNEKETNISFEIKGSKSQAKSLTAQIHQMQMKMMKQEEVVYSVDLQIQGLERKVARASGETSDLEAIEVNAKMGELEKELEERKDEETFVSTQLKKTDEEYRSSKRKRDELHKKLSQVQEKKSELILQSETCFSVVKALDREKEEKMLARDLLQMEVNRLEEILNLKTDDVYGMENTRQRLKMSIEERKTDIENRQRRQRAKLKSVQESLHYLALKRKKLYLHCEKLQSKYEVLLKRIKVEEGQERSPQYYVIKAAQERELIQREGYELEEQVKKAEQDIKSLERAMDQINEANNLLLHSHRSDKSLKLLDEQAKLKEQLDDVFDRLKSKQTTEATLLQEVANVEARLENLDKEHNTVGEALRELEQKLEVANKDLEEQTIKHNRATHHLDKLSKELKQCSGNDIARQIEKEMLLVELRETIRDVLYKLKALANDYPELKAIIEDKVNEAGLKMPSRTSSVASGRSSSRSSSSVGSSSVRSSLSGSAYKKSNSSDSGKSSTCGSIVNVELNL
eukprot:Gb_26076 [translate_table: standard]